MTDEKTNRSFLAFALPEEVLQEIGRVQNRLRRRISGDVRWVRPEAIHLTLKFFGDVPVGDLPHISAVMEKMAAAVAPFDLTVGGVGVFPDPQRPRIVWLGMGGDAERLVSFQKGMEREFEEIGFPQEERPFRPHLTLARIRSKKGLTGLDGVLEKGETYAAGRFIATGLSLFKSDLTPQGAIYTRLAAYPFCGKKGM